MIRRRIFQIFLLLALLPAGWRLAVLAGPGGEPLRQEAARLARHEGELAASRGRIFSSDGTLLAWSERHYDLCWHGTELPAALTRRLPQILPGWDGALPGGPEKGPLLLRRDLTLPEAEAADALAATYPALEVVLRWERRTAGDEALRAQIGAVQLIDAQEWGVSGWEKEFDGRLRGRNGRYAVLLDRHGRWIDRTFRQLEPPQPGEDVHLSREDAP